MDPRSFAYLDKSRDKVMCGSCGKWFADIESWRHSAYTDPTYRVPGPDRVEHLLTGYKPIRLSLDNGDNKYPPVHGKEFILEVEGGIGRVFYISRVLLISWAYRLHPDDIWRLTKRASNRVQQRKYHSIRRQHRTDLFYDLGTPVTTTSTIHAGQSSKDYIRGNNGEDISLPIRIQCMYCPSIQFLTAERLEVEGNQFLMGTDSLAYRSRFWSQDAIEKRYPEDTRPYKCRRI